MLPAIGASRNGRTVAIASRDLDRAQAQAETFGIARVHKAYADVLADTEVDAVYIPLANHLHREWTVAALEAGKHVLCEKPLATSLADAEAMAASARATGRLLMEAFMYRFHPRMGELRHSAADVRFLHACFGFPLRDPQTYRRRAQFGGGALLDVGVYTLDVARWFLGEPQRITAVAHRGESEVDMTVTMALAFADGRQASLWCSFESPEHQELTLVEPNQTRRVERPFTSRHDPHDPYQLMVEAFADAVLNGDQDSPVPIESSVANLRAVEMVRAATARTSSR